MCVCVRVASKASEGYVNKPSETQMKFPSPWLQQTIFCIKAFHHIKPFLLNSENSFK